MILPSRYVGPRRSKAGSGFCANFAIDVTGLTCIDIGASTGGFTDWPVAGIGAVV